MGGESKLGQLQGNTLLSTARSLCLFVVVAAVAAAVWVVVITLLLQFCVLPCCRCFCSKRAIQSIEFSPQSLYVEIRIDYNTNGLKVIFLVSRPTVGDRLEFCFCVSAISRGFRSYDILQRQARSILMNGRWLKREDVGAR